MNIPTLPPAGEVEDRPTLALIAHDGKKPEMVAFAMSRPQDLRRFKLVATGTTGRLVAETADLVVERLQSGPVGGDAQVAARVATGDVQAVIFLVDPLDRHPHDSDIQMLQRVCNVHNVPLATNAATAGLVLSGLISPC